MQVNLQNFTLLHNYLLSILSTNNYESEHLPQKIMQYIGMIVQSQKNASLNEDLFDFFCENNGNKIIKLTLQVDPMLSVKVLSMLFINLSSHHWISYLLCQPFIVDAIQYEDVPHEQQWPEFYISLLKSMSIRLNQQQLSLFYNKKFCKFPLIYQALKYYNHPDCMVRTNVMNIILGIMKIKDQRLAKYFGRLPFTSYVLTYCCQVRSRIISLNEHLQKVSEKSVEQFKSIENEHHSIVRSYFIDLIDYICYLNDIIELGPSQLAYFVQNCTLTYIVLPTLEYINEKKSSLLVCSTLFLIFTIFKNITNQKFKQSLCILVMGRQIPKCIIDQLSRKREEMVYIPKIYSEQFEPNKYYWKNFEYQIEKQCMKLFDDVKDFQTDHEEKQENLQQTKEFMQEVDSISECLGFNILNYQCVEGKVPLNEISNLIGFENKENQIKVKLNIKQSQVQMVDNPIREQIIKILQNSIRDYKEDSTIMCISTFINNFTTSESLRNKVLEYCGLLLPRLDTVNYKNEYNLKSMDRFKAIGLQFISKINEGFTNNISIKEKQRKKQQNQDKIKQQCVQIDLQLFGLASIKNLSVLFFEGLHERMKQQEQMHIIQLYRRSILEIKELIAKKNMKILVQNFQVEYIKWTKQSLFHSTNLTQSILTPRKSANQLKSESEAEQQSDSSILNKLYFKDNKQKILYYIQKFVFVQTFFVKYYETYIQKLPIQIKKMKLEEQQEEDEEDIKSFFYEKYTSVYNQKYCKIQQKWKIGYYYQIDFRHMVECFTQEKKNKNTKRLIIVEDHHNLVIVQPSKQENKAKIIANHPWKYVFCEIDRQTGRKMAIKLFHCHRGDNKITVFFEDELRSAGTLEWMNGLKYERYQSEQAFILSYIKDCLMRIQRLKNKQ